MRGDDAVFESQFEGAAGVVEFSEEPVEEVDGELAHGEEEQQGGEEPGAGGGGLLAGGYEGGEDSRGHDDDEDVDAGSEVPPAGREEEEAYVGVAGLFQQLLHEGVLVHPPSAAEAHYAVAVVLFGAVLHAVVHAGFLGGEEAFGVGDGFDHLAEGDAGEFAERHPEVHHHQVLLGGTLQIVAVGMFLVGGTVVVGAAGAHGVAELCQPPQEEEFEKGQQGIDLGVGEVIAAAFLGVGEEAEEEPLVDGAVAAVEVGVEALHQGGYA